MLELAVSNCFRALILSTPDGTSCWLSSTGSVEGRGLVGGGGGESSSDITYSMETPTCNARAKDT